MVGYSRGGKISNCINHVDIQGNYQLGGIVGATDEGIVSNCVNYGTINGNEWYIGGIVGRNNGTIENCESNAKIQGKYLVGEIVGLNETSNAKIDGCYNKGIVTSTGATKWVQDGENETEFAALTGGITGHNYGTVTRSINKGTVTSKYRVTGGISGRNCGTISFCCNSGDVSGYIGVGGITGNNRKNIFNVYNIATQIQATEEVNGNCNVGGIAGGQNNETTAYIEFAYNKSKIIAKSGYIAGIVGEMKTGTLNKVYNMGEIDTPSTTNIGQIAGYKYDTSKITNFKILTEAEMIGWTQEAITTNLEQFVKKANSLPILNITVRGITF